MDNKFVFSEQEGCDPSLEKRIFKICLSIGIPTNVKGFSFLCNAIKSVVLSPNRTPSLMKDVYPVVARNFDTTPLVIERAIRHAIDVAWAHGANKYINNYFNIEIFHQEKPTNGELIALLSEQVRLDLLFEKQVNVRRIPPGRS